MTKILNIKINILFVIIIIIILSMLLGQFIIRGLIQRNKASGRDYVKAGFLSDMKAADILLNINEKENHNKIFSNISSHKNINISDVLSHLSGKNIGNDVLKSFYLIDSKEKCFYFALDIDDNFNGELKKSFITYFGKEEHSFSKCKGENCKIFFTEKGLLKSGDEYNCD